MDNMEKFKHWEDIAKYDLDTAEVMFKKAFHPGLKDKEFIEKEKEYAPLFAELLAYYISDRYPSYRENLSTSIGKQKAKEVLKQSKEVFAWLRSLQRL